MQKILSFLVFILFFATLSFADCSNFQSALETASKLRNLKILKPVECRVVSKEQFSEIIKKSSQLALDKLELEEIVNKMIGLVPINYDYKNCYLVNDLESVIASYIPEEKAVLIPDKTESSFDLLVHEATHALQDQHFNLLKLSKVTSSTTDSYFSFLAIAEGDAELVQANYLESIKKIKKNNNNKEDTKKTKNICEMPVALSFQLDFPYFWGKRYVSTLKNVNDSFKFFPKYTTEIIYHNRINKFSLPKKGELLRLINQQYPNLLNKKPVLEDSLGEYTIRCILRELIGSRLAVIAGYGWTGDRIALYEFKNDNKHHAISWIINLKTEKDAQELISALKKSFEVRFQTKINTNQDTIIIGNSIYPKIYLNRAKDKVKLVIGDKQL